MNPGTARTRVARERAWWASTLGAPQSENPDRESFHIGIGILTWRLRNSMKIHAHDRNAIMDDKTTTNVEPRQETSTEARLVRWPRGLRLLTARSRCLALGLSLLIELRSSPSRESDRHLLGLVPVHLWNSRRASRLRFYSELNCRAGWWWKTWDHRLLPQGLSPNPNPRNCCCVVLCCVFLSFFSHSRSSFPPVIEWSVVLV